MKLVEYVQPQSVAVYIPLIVMSVTTDPENDRNIDQEGALMSS